MLFSCVSVNFDILCLFIYLLFFAGTMPKSTNASPPSSCPVKASGGESEESDETDESTETPGTSEAASGNLFTVRNFFL